MSNVEETSVLAVLEGGPPSLPEALRVQTVSAFAQKIKIPHYGRYEHFERTNAAVSAGGFTRRTGCCRDRDRSHRGSVALRGFPVRLSGRRS